MEGMILSELADVDSRLSLDRGDGNQHPPLNSCHGDRAFGSDSGSSQNSPPDSGSFFLAPPSVLMPTKITVLRRFVTGIEGKKSKRRKTNLKKDRHWVLFLNHHKTKKGKTNADQFVLYAESPRISTETSGIF